MLRLILKLCLLWKVTEALFHLPLGHDTTLYWNVDYGTKELVVEVHTVNLDPNGGWTGIGFSNYGNLTEKDNRGDFCIAWRSSLNSHRKDQGHFQLTDVHLQDGVILPDHHQDCLDFKYVFKNNTLKWTFRRKFVTCDVSDYALEEGTTHLHWIKGNGPLFDIKGVSIKKASELGMVRVRLLKNLKPDPVLDPKTTFRFEVINSKVKVPAVETTYWCHIVKLPERMKEKHQIVQFAVNVQKGNEDLVHHMEVFHCVASPSTEFPMYSGSCDDSPSEISVCSRVMAAWAMGAEPLHYPKDVGYPIGGPDFNPYLRLEIHYNNPKKKADWVDSSGMSFWVTQNFRPHDAGIIELGLEYTDKNSIPPQHEGFTLTGVCNRECTSVGLPPTGITVFASQLHTHLTGTRVITRHFRRRDDIYYREQNLQNNYTEPSDLEGYIELPTFNGDNHYSTHFQEIRLLKRPVKVLPGDVLLTSCEHKTMDRANMTLGGFQISDEMCVNYIHYYPRANLEVCKSSVSMKSLREYFTFLKTMDGQPVNPDGPISENYNAVQWTPFRANLLEDFYNRSPIDMQCNQSDGTRFPGTWEHMPVPKFPDLTPRLNPNKSPDCGSNSGNIAEII